MKKLLPLLLLALSLLCLRLRLQAQPVSPLLDSMLARCVDSMRTVVGIKSLSAALHLKDAAWAGARGISSLNPPVNVTPADAYLIGSITKPITAACVLQLADEQRLSLDDSLHEWLSPFPNVDPNITIRQLLRHQSGLADIFANPATTPALLDEMDSVWAAADIIRTFLLPPLNKPGGAWNYCNTNYILLGLIIEKVSGNPYHVELRNRFFAPMKLNSFAFPAFEALTAPVAHVWMDLDGDGQTEDSHDFYMDWKSLNAAGGAAGGYFATAADLSRWMWSYMRGDLLTPAMMAEARTTISAPALRVGQYGLGMMRHTMAGLTAYGHGGDLSYSGSAWYFPARDISISVLGNDATRNSWQLLPVVEALLKTYLSWQQATALPLLERDVNTVVAWPSPFSETLHLAVSAPVPAERVRAELFCISGQRVAASVKGSTVNGQTVMHFDGLGSLPAGVYAVRVYADERVLKSVLVVR